MNAAGFVSTMEEVIENSFKDYHVKGFDYICLKRTPELTIKLYFFDGDVSKLPEVVNPHDHRYNFRTRCLAGEVENSCYMVDQRGEVYNRFEYRTPLNGGDGFTWDGTTHLLEMSRKRYHAMQGYNMQYEDIHTIRLVQNNTILMLTQYEDEMAITTPTMTYSREAKLPLLSGLYNRFTPDQVRKRFKQLQEYADLGIALSA